MAHYLATYYLSGPRYPPFGTKEVPLGSRYIQLEKREWPLAWEEAVNIANEMLATSPINRSPLYTKIDKIEVYELVAEQTYEENQKQSGKRKRVKEEAKTDDASFVPSLVPKMLPA